MKVLYDWLKEFVDVQAPAAELRSPLSMAGVAVDSIEDTAAGPLLDAEITINRPDLLGHYGIAREAAALFRLALKPVQPKIREASEKASSVTRIEIECSEYCGRYTARILRGVKIQPSPDWLRRRLEALGESSINNVVDVTNYVMLELGQPLHAFDLDRLHERRIVVRRGRQGEKIRTLDGFERMLSKEMCLICDASRPVAIGGVMGGAETEISFASKNILLESAWFDPVSIRRTSKALNLRTEASTRFERGADPEMAEMASRRAAELIQQLAGGEILAGVVDEYPRREQPIKLELTRKELLRVMGADVPDRAIEEILSALGFAPVRVDANRGSAGSLAAVWECQRPSWRRDIEREIDLIEEVARLYGYDKFPARLPAAKVPAARQLHAAAEDNLRERLVALGYQEILSIPLVNPERDAPFRTESVTPAEISNPLSEDASVLRTSGVVNMLQALEWNLNRGQRNLRLFEIGKAYEVRAGQPVERRILTLGATGFAREKSIHDTAREFGFADLKGNLDRILELAGGANWSSSNTQWLAAGRAARISLCNHSGALLGVGGQLARRVAQRFKLRQEIYLAELQLEPLLEAIAEARAAVRFKTLPRFSAVERDFSLVLPDSATFTEVAESIRHLEIAELRSVRAVDLFRGGQIPAGKYSLLVRVEFQSAETTLTEAQLTDFSRRIVSALEQKVSATLRAS